MFNMHPNYRYHIQTAKNSYQRADIIKNKKGAATQAGDVQLFSATFFREHNTTASNKWNKI